MSDNKSNDPCGILVIDKPEGKTSHDIVGAIRRLYGTKRVGHTGTLDPLATGVLVILIGRAAKASEYAVSSRKKYIATMRLGIESDTEDISGNILSHRNVDVTEEEVRKVAQNFKGRIYQVPPMYSALKRDGKKLCDIARAGGTVERQARPIDIFELEVEKIDDNDYKLSVECSAGTYIRTLCADIGKKLGCGAVMAALRRTEACGFSLNKAVTLEILQNDSLEDRLMRLRPTEELFKSLGAIKLSVFYEKLFRSGCEIYLKKAGIKPFDVGTRVRVLNAHGEFFALGEVHDYPDGLAIKSVKLFVL